MGSHADKILQSGGRLAEGCHLLSMAPTMQGQAQASQASEAGPSQQPDGQQAQERPQQRQSRQELPKNYVANMLGAIGALQKHEKYALILDCSTSAIPPSCRSIPYKTSSA